MFPNYHAKVATPSPMSLAKVCRAFPAPGSVEWADIWNNVCIKLHAPASKPHTAWMGKLTFFFRLQPQVSLVSNKRCKNTLRLNTAGQCRDIYICSVKAARVTLQIGSPKEIISILGCRLCSLWFSCTGFPQLPQSKHQHVILWISFFVSCSFWEGSRLNRVRFLSTLLFSSRVHVLTRLTRLLCFVVLLLISLGIPAVAKIETWKLDSWSLRPGLDFLLDCRRFASPVWRHGELWEDR